MHRPFAAASALAANDRGTDKDAKGLVGACALEYHWPMVVAALQRQALAAALAGVATAGLLVLTLAPREAASRAVFDAIEELCSGLASSVGAASDGGAYHRTTPGLYMPMFSTPPKGGPIYNGPPLDDC
jgi:hypothetical protein